MSLNTLSVGTPSVSSLYAAKSWIFNTPDTPQEAKAKEALQQFYTAWISTPDEHKQNLLDRVTQGSKNESSKKTDDQFKNTIESSAISFPPYSNINGKNLGFLFQHARDIQKLKMRAINLDPNDLVESIKNLKQSSPDIEEINLTGFPLTKSQFQTILSSFPYLKKLTMRTADQGTAMTPNEYFDVILPWITNNSKLESFGPLPLSTSNDQLNQLVEALPATVNEFIIGSYDTNLMDSALVAVSKKLGGGIYTLIFTSGCPSNDFFKKIADHFPNLIHLRFSIGASIPKTFKDAILEYDPNQLKTVKFPLSTLISDDLVAIFQKFPQEDINLRLWMPDDMSYDKFSQITQLLVQQNCLKKIRFPDALGLFSVANLTNNIKILTPLLPQLEEFSITYWDAFDDDTILYLAQNLKNVKKFMPWFQSQCRWSEDTFPKLFEALSTNSPQLEYLGFFNGLNNVSRDVLLEGASKLPNLRFLDLSSNNKYSFLEADVIKFVESCPNLEVINLLNSIASSELTQLKEKIKKLRRDINVLG